MKGLNKFSRKKKEFNPTVFFLNRSIPKFYILITNSDLRSVDSFIHFASHGVKFHSFGMSNDRLYKLIHRLVITY